MSFNNKSHTFMNSGVFYWLKLFNVKSLSTHINTKDILHNVNICCSVPYTDLLRVCPFWKRDFSSVSVPEFSSILFPSKSFSWANWSIWRTEEVIYCTYCKTPLRQICDFWHWAILQKQKNTKIFNCFPPKICLCFPNQAKVLHISIWRATQNSFSLNTHSKIYPKLHLE